MIDGQRIHTNLDGFIRVLHCQRLSHEILPCMFKDASEHHVLFARLILSDEQISEVVFYFSACVLKSQLLSAVSHWFHPHVLAR